MDRRDFYLLLTLTLVLVGGVTLLLIQKRIPPSMQGNDAPAVRIPGAIPSSPAPVSPDETSDVSTSAPGKNYVIWLSIDGIRPDYLDRASTPFFDYLRAHGAYSLDTEVVFPSVTFSSHVSFATGLPVREHGIPANRFFDASTGQILSYPPSASLLEAEPIWTTVQRQGVRTGVWDWPLSHQQTGPDATDYFGQRYVPGLSDRDRLWQVLEGWKNDPDPATLQLLMGYAVGPDSPGHAFGPNSPEVENAVTQIDQTLGEFYQDIRDFFNSFRDEGDQMILVITSDHGMSEVHTLVHPGFLSGLEGQEGVVAVHSANITHYYFLPSLPAEQRDELIRTASRRINLEPFAQAYRREELPSSWAFTHPTRVGDLVAVLQPGYTFSRRPSETTGSAAEMGGPLGMHGYHPDETDEMSTVTLFHRYPTPLGSRNLGSLSYQKLHPTVAFLLGVNPAPKVSKKPIEIMPILRDN